jgi:hypothetical protein
LEAEGFMFVALHVGENNNVEMFFLVKLTICIFFKNLGVVLPKTREYMYHTQKGAS